MNRLGRGVCLADVQERRPRKSPKDLIREAGRMLDVAETEIEKVCKLVGDWAFLSDALDGQYEFGELYHKSKVHQRWIDLAIAGTFKEHNP